MSGVKIYIIKMLIITITVIILYIWEAAWLGSYAEELGIIDQDTSILLIVVTVLLIILVTV
jgi:hypothetical protein